MSTIKQYIFSANKHDGKGWPPEDAEGFIAWFRDLLAAMPADGSNPAVELDYDYDEGCPRIEISYERDKTEADLAHERKQEQERADRQRKRDLKELSRLEQMYRGRSGGKL